jgi:glutamyl-tRNA synthetase
MVEMAESSRCFFEEFAEYQPEAAQAHLTPAVLPAFEQLHQELRQLQPWSAAGVHTHLAAIAETKGLKLGKLAQPLRVAVTGGTVSPPIDVTVAVMGRERALFRVERAIAHIRAKSP